MKRFLSILVALVMTLTCFAGLAVAEGKTNINFYIASDMEANAVPIVEKYNTMQDTVHVELITIPNDGYDDKMKTLTAGGSDIDAFWVRTPAQAKNYMANNVLENLKPYAEAAGLNLAPIEANIQAVSDEEGFYGLPVSGSCWMLFYNKDLFDAKGLDYPINLTWDQYADLCKELTYTDGDQKYWGGLNPNWTPNLGAIPTGEYLDAEELPNTRKYEEILHRMYVEDKSMPSIAEMSTGTFDCNAYFAAGNIYTMINGDWTLRLLDAGFTWAAAPLPVLSEEYAEHSCGHASVVAVASSSTHKQEAYDFVQFYTTSPEATSITASNGEVPSYATEEAMKVYQESVTIDGVAYRFSSKILAEQGTAGYYAQILDAFAEEMQLYLLDEQSIDEAFDNYLALREEIMNE
ncbi:MAG: extracellular solute-binding protein [Clostridia bacterium]|nr:extracellular solute-binding protein [Clostridia bacterium]MDD6039603.1 extracellular solute-binding protein [Clostridia bacterium]